MDGNIGYIDLNTLGDERKLDEALQALTGTRGLIFDMRGHPTGIGGWADEQIIRAFRYGIDTDNAELCPAMPRYPTIGDVEARAIVAYLRSLPAVERAIPDSMCPPVKPTPGPDMAMPTD